MQVTMGPKGRPLSKIGYDVELPNRLNAQHSEAEVSTTLAGEDTQPEPERNGRAPGIGDRYHEPH